MGTMQELEQDWIKAIPGGNLLTHLTLLTAWQEGWIQWPPEVPSNISFLWFYAWQYADAELHMCLFKIQAKHCISTKVPLPFSFQVSSQPERKKRDYFKVARSMCLQHAATFPNSPWHDTADRAFLTSLCSLFSPSNHFFDQLNWLGQQKASSGVLQTGCTAISDICIKSADAVVCLAGELHAFCLPCLSPEKASFRNISNLVILCCPFSISLHFSKLLSLRKADDST